MYSSGLNRILVPARQSGLYLVEPDSGSATRLQGTGTVDSADEGRGLLFLLDRSRRTITVARPADGRVLSSVKTSAPGDYVRYVPATGDLWVTEPQASPSGIEIFALSQGAVPVARRLGFVVVAGGPEGLEVSSTRGSAYTHAGSEVVAIDVAMRAVTARWPTGCQGTHGFPRIDERHDFVLASCAVNGGVSLLDPDDGRQLGRYAVGGGEALPAYSESARHFYVRSDPGTTIATLQPSNDGLVLIRQVVVPEIGHCLTADNLGHYWTCDSQRGRILRFDDPP
ncbi:MAG: hypothetical protein M3O70_27310 [Actinomycetota bacterium]|nr:hypothetical protein [Actinomycetota bacterium]